MIFPYIWISNRHYRIKKAGKRFYSVVSIPATAHTGHSLVYAVPSKASATTPKTGEAIAGRDRIPDTRFKL